MDKYEFTFARIISDKAKDILKSESKYVEPLVSLEYLKELELKQEALSQLLTTAGINHVPEKIIQSPKPRYYRTTTKRKVVPFRSAFYLGFQKDYDDKLAADYYSKIEPREHGDIYKFLLQKLSKSDFKILGKNINYLIIRGSYTEFALILNVKELNAEIVRKIKYIVDDIKKTDLKVTSIYTLLDEDSSDYYIDSSIAEKPGMFKRYIGYENLLLRVDDENKYLYHPLSFTQVNESMIKTFLDAIKSEITGGENGGGRLLDLYCGYGLFTYYLAPLFKEVVSVDIDGNSIRAAMLNKKFYNFDTKIKFISENITANSLERVFRTIDKLEKLPETILLDPPRSGTSYGVIDMLATRGAKRVVQIFCSADEIARSVREWQNNKYTIEKIIPFDMFSGTPALETAVVFKR